MEEKKSIDDNVVYTEQDGTKYVVMSTKVTLSEYNKLCRIAKIECESKYSILQWAISMIIRLKDVGTTITNELTKACIAFGVETKFMQRYNLCNPTLSPSVHGAIFFIGNSKMKGLQPVYVDKPFMGDAIISENIQDMFDLFIQHINPSMYKKMFRESSRRSLSNIYNLQCELVMENDGIEDTDEIERLFGDNRKDDYGRTMADAPYRRTMINNQESFEKRLERENNQMKLNFNE